jgi:hypothetical protein
MAIYNMTSISHYQGNLPWVTRADGYDPKLPDTIGSLQPHIAREPYTSCQETNPHL